MQIAILLYPQFTALDAIGPMEVLSSLPGTRVSFVAEKKGLIPNDTGLLSVDVNTSLEEMPQPDVIVVPGGPGCYAVMSNEGVLNWLRQAHSSTRWTTSVCTGALILGAAGLLQGTPATTYWASFKELAQWGAVYQHERYVKHGRIFTAAGVSAGIDMTLALSKELSNTATAQAIQLFIEYDPQPPMPMQTPPITMEGELHDQVMLVWEHRIGHSDRGRPAAKNAG